MAHTLTEAMDSRRKGTIHFEATCYKITRVDGVQLFLTDAQEPLTLIDGNTYAPAGGFNTTAQRKSTSLDDQHFEASGVLTANTITDEDMRTGRYMGARIDKFLVDYRVPWAGTFQHTTGWISNISYDNEAWKAEVEGFTSRLKQESGDDAATTCRNDLADSFGQPSVPGCKADLIALGFIFFGHSVQSLDLSAPKRKFVGNTIGFSAGEFNLGKVTWLTGKNAGVVSRIRTHAVLGSLTLFELFLELPSVIAVSDTYDTQAGCNKLAGVLPEDTSGHCVHKYNQLVNFGGDPYLPGTGRVVRTPI